MANTTSVNLRIDKELKTQAETLFSSLGMNMTTAINVFLKQAVRTQGIPFRISAVNDYDEIPANRGRADQFDNYDTYVAESLKAADVKVAEGKMKYYTAEEIRAGLEELLNADI